MPFSVYLRKLNVMKRFFKTVCACALILLCASMLLVSCKKQPDDNKYEAGHFVPPDYSSLDLDDYVVLGKYKGLTLDARDQELFPDTFLWTAITDSAEIKDYPKDAVDYYVVQRTRYYKFYADSSNMSLEEFMKVAEITQLDIIAEAKDCVKDDLVQLAIIKEEGIELTDEEKAKYFDKYVAQYVNVYGYSEEYARENLKDEIYGSMIYDKMMEFLLLNNTVITLEE